MSAAELARRIESEVTGEPALTEDERSPLAPPTRLAPRLAYHAGAYDGAYAALAMFGDELKRALTALEGERAERNRCAREAADLRDELDTARQALRDLEQRGADEHAELITLQSEQGRLQRDAFVEGARWAWSRSVGVEPWAVARREAERRWPE